MRYSIQPMSEADARRICEWRYPAPYDCYNWPAWPALLHYRHELADEDIRAAQYASAYLPDEGLAGYIQFFPMEGVTRLGLGLRPDLCGRGLGVPLASQAAEEARTRRPTVTVDLEVAIWNIRASRCYAKAGFRQEQTYDRPTAGGPLRVICMVYAPVCLQESSSEK